MALAARFNGGDGRVFLDDGGDGGGGKGFFPRCHQSRAYSGQNIAAAGRCQGMGGIFLDHRDVRVGDHGIGPFQKNAAMAGSGDRAGEGHLVAIDRWPFFAVGGLLLMLFGGGMLFCGGMLFGGGGVLTRPQTLPFPAMGCDQTMRGKDGEKIIPMAGKGVQRVGIQDYRFGLPT